MIGIDTNILIRYVVRDHPEQAEKAKVIMKSFTPQHQGFVNSIVLAEFIWVLERRYKYNRKLIHSFLEKLLPCRELEFEHSNAAWYATNFYLNSKADFADLFIGRINYHYGCSVTKTFDKKASNSREFEKA